MTLIIPLAIMAVIIGYLLWEADKELRNVQWELSDLKDTK